VSVPSIATTGVCGMLKASPTAKIGVIGPHPSSPYRAVPIHPICPDHEQPHGLGGPSHCADARRRPEDVQEENNEQKADKRAKAN
jgi:hypothetical protein